MSQRLGHDVRTPGPLAVRASWRRGSRPRNAAAALAVLVAVGAGAFVGLRVIGNRHVSFPLAGKIRPPAPAHAYWGVYRAGAPGDRERLTSLEDELGRRPALLMWYQEWAGEPQFPAADAAWLYERGIVPMITWEPWEPRIGSRLTVIDQPTYRLSNIAAGDFDHYLRDYATEVRRFGGPVMIRIFHEMDGNWYPWGGTVNGNEPADLVAAWRHVHDVFQEAGATNVTWIWSVNKISVPVTPGNSIERYWPGWDYVDWVGISGFNWGITDGRNTWQSFEEVNGERFRQLLGYGKPIAVTETGAPEVGGDKAAWIGDVFSGIRSRYPKLAALVWFDRRKAPGSFRDYRIESSPQSVEAFRQAIRSPYVLSAAAAQRTAIAN